MLKSKEPGWITELSRITGIKRTTLNDVYDVQEIRRALKQDDVVISEEPSISLILATRGLEKEDRISLLVKAVDMEWSRGAIAKVKIAIKDLADDVKKYLIDDKRTRTPHTVITAISQLPLEQQMETIKIIKEKRLDEGASLKVIERVMKGEQPLELKIEDKYQEVIDSFGRVYSSISKLGYNQYMIMGSRWGECLEILDRIEAKIQEIRQLERKQVVSIQRNSGDN